MERCEDFQEHDHRKENLLKERDHLQHTLKSNQERLRKLCMVKIHRSKASLDDLAALTNKWRSVAQTAAEQLLASSPVHPPPSMAALLTSMHIEPSVIQYCPIQEAFY